MTRADQCGTARRRLQAVANVDESSGFQPSEISTHRRLLELQAPADPRRGGGPGKLDRDQHSELGPRGALAAQGAVVRTSQRPFELAGARSQAISRNFTSLRRFRADHWLYIQPPSWRAS